MARTHGMCGTVEYATWARMINRCERPNDKSYKNYGGRGIVVCDRWKESPKNFLEDMGYRPSDNHSIDRIDVNGNYEPSNCRWATQKEQNNNRRGNINITHNSKTKTLAEWCDDLGLSYAMVSQRINKYGMTFSEAITKPAKNTTTYRFNGKDLTLKEWGKELGVASKTLWYRLKSGYPYEDVFVSSLNKKPNQRLTTDNVKEIKKLILYALSDIEISKAFGVSRSAINMIRNNRRYNEVTI